MINFSHIFCTVKSKARKGKGTKIDTAKCKGRRKQRKDIGIRERDTMINDAFR